MLSIIDLVAYPALVSFHVNKARNESPVEDLGTYTPVAASHRNGGYEDEDDEERTMRTGCRGEHLQRSSERDVPDRCFSDVHE